ncbi:MAG: hypothetical protein QM760_12745 [Nibricoccus sp.]
MPRLHDHDCTVDVGEFVREQKKIRLPRITLIRRVVHQQVDFLVTRLLARLHVVLAQLPDKKTVLLKIFADDAFVDG